MMLATYDMVDGHMNGSDPNSPEPLGNRSAAYRHGFTNGRDDLGRKPRESASRLREMAEQAIVEDKLLII